jgi:hypothetical protein
MGFLLEGRGVSFQVLFLFKDSNSILMVACHWLISNFSMDSFIVWGAFKNISMVFINLFIGWMIFLGQK